MPLPSWLGAVNKRVFNRREIRNGVRPVLHHVGRTSGNEYQTPLATHSIDDGFLFVMMYGSTADWVQNVLASGTALLDIDGNHIALTEPRVIPMDEAVACAPSITPPPTFLQVGEVLRMSTLAA